MQIEQTHEKPTSTVSQRAPAFSPRHAVHGDRADSISLIFSHSFSSARRTKKAFAVGHMALGYILARLSSKPLKVNINIQLVFTLAVISDVDLLFEPALAHRGPLHSIVLLIPVFVTLFLVYRKVAMPYFLAVAQHSLIGDYLGGGQLQLFWPLNDSYYGLATPAFTILILEWTLFVSSILIMAKTRDLYAIFESKKSTMLLVVPLAAVLVPSIFGFPLRVPLSLIPAHVAYSLLFLTSLALALTRFFRRSWRQRLSLNRSFK
jgi:hypothetical protein